VNIEELKKIAEARTKGPWEKGTIYNKTSTIDTDAIFGRGGQVGQVLVCEHRWTFDDRDFIIAMENHIDELLQVVELAKQAHNIAQYGDGYMDTHTCRDLGEALRKLEAK
jgi:hypothetical protein